MDFGTIEVEGQGGSYSEPGGWRGSLETTPLAEIFRRIALEERSGDFQITSDSTSKTVYFDQGFIVFASSNLKSDGLRKQTIESGRISRREFAVARMLMMGSNHKFGEALVRDGVMSEEELGREVAAQVNRLVVSLFSLRQGIFRFDERLCNIPLELMVSLSVYRILIEGIRCMRSKKLVLAGLPPLQTKVRIVKEPPFTVDFDKLLPVEKAVLREVANGAPLHQVAKAARKDEGVVLRACYALYAAGLLEAATPEPQPRRPLRVQEETGTFVLSEIRQRIRRQHEASSQEPQIELELEEELQAQTAGTSSRPCTDGTGQETSDESAFKGPYSSEEEGTESREEEPLLELELEEEPATSGAARAEAVTNPPAPADESSRPPSASLDGDLPVEQGLEADDAPSMLNHIPVEEIEFDSGSRGFEVIEDETFADGPEPSEDLRPPTDDKATAAPAEREGAKEGKPHAPPGKPAPEFSAPAPVSSPEEGPPRGSTTAPTRDQKGEAEEAAPVGERERPPRGVREPGAEARLRRDVKLHFKMRDWEGAVPLLEQLVGISPGTALYRGMLGRAMSRLPQMSKDAEEHFVEALRLSPQDPELHYWMGAYYKSFGLKSRAVTEFRTVLRIDPKHKGARQQLSGSGNDQPRGMLKKIFG